MRCTGRRLVHDGGTMRRRCCCLLAVLVVTASGCRTARPAPAPAPAPAPLRTERSSACVLDEVRESFCATRRAATCSVTARDESAFHTTNVLPTTDLRAGGAVLPTFALDTNRAATGDGTCCFTRCTLLAVSAVHRPAPNEPSTNPPTDGAYSSQDICIPPPEGGTSIPADANEACPAAVSFGARSQGPSAWGGTSPYIGDSNGRCCYRVAFASQW